MEQLIVEVYDFFIYINIVGPIITIIALLLRYRQTKRVINLGMIIPMLYSSAMYSGVYLATQGNADAHELIRLFQIPTRMLIALNSLTLLIFLVSEIISYRIILGGIKYARTD